MTVMGVAPIPASDTRVTLKARMPLRAKFSLIACAALPLLLVLSVCAPSRSRAVRNGKAACDPVVQAIEAHRTDHGAYPASLEELSAFKRTSAVPAVPTYWNMRERPLAYSASRDGSVFCVKFGYTGVFDGHATHVYYLSTNGTWLDKQYEPPDVDWEAALLHGQEYQVSGSATALRCAVTSLAHAQVELLHALHIQDSLGQPNTPPGDEQDESDSEWRYDGTDGETYVFSFDSHLVHEIHKVQRDECGNERRNVLKRYPRSGR